MRELSITGQNAPKMLLLRVILRLKGTNVSTVRKMAEDMSRDQLVDALELSSAASGLAVPKDSVAAILAADHKSARRMTLKMTPWWTWALLAVACTGIVYVGITLALIAE